MLKRAVVLAGLVALIGTAAGAQPKALLVRMESRGSAPEAEIRDEVLVYRDGTVLVRIEGEAPLVPRQILISRELASEAQIKALGAALLENRVAAQVGGCHLELGDAEFDSVQVQVDWFGKGFRQRSFLTDTQFAAACGAEINAIVTAIAETAGDALLEDVRTVADLIEDE
jgi:hypothetical protein